jgi:aminopeptidase N
MGHSWFGNYITCASWQDIWINEGFAVYSEYIASQNLRTEQESRGWLENSMNTAKDYPDGSVYIPIEEATSVGRIFDYVLTYKKGGMLVHMIRYLINDDEIFFDVLQNHLQTYGGSVATGEDFRNILETVSGQDFEIFFDEWYYGEGYPTYESNWYQENDTIYLSNIETTSSETTSLFTIPVEYRINFSNGENSYIRLSQDANYVEHKIIETRNVESIEIDPDMWILCDKSIQQVSDIDIQEISASVSPNPSNGQFKVQLNKAEPLSVEIYNSQGQKITNFKSDESLINIDLTNNKSGIYLLLLTNKIGNQKHIRLIKY